MSRPAAIAALDEALKKHLADLDAAEQNQVRVARENAAAIAAIEAVHAEAKAAADAAQKARMDAYYGARDCENAIRKLGFFVLGRSDGMSHLDKHPGDFRNPITTPAHDPAEVPAEVPGTADGGER